MNLLSVLYKAIKIVCLKTEREKYMEKFGLYEKICNEVIVLGIKSLSKYGSEWTLENICSAIEEMNDNFKDFMKS